MKKLILYLILVTSICAWSQDSDKSTITSQPSQETQNETEDLLKPQICFAPDSDERYVQEITSRYSLGANPLFQTGATNSRFQLQSRWSATATDGPGLIQGDPTVLTWSYLADGTNISGFAGEPASPSNLQAWLNGLYGNFNTWHALFVEVFDRWSEKTGITYVYEPNDDAATFPNFGGVLGVRGDIRIGAHFIDGNSNILAYNFFPNFGDMVLDSADNFYNDLSGNSLKFRNVVAHEHGHGMGLSHTCPVNQTKLMEPFASTAFDGPQFDDVLGAQRHYGDSWEHNDTAPTATNLGAFAPGTTASLDCLSVDDNSDANYYQLNVGANALLTVTVGPPAVAPYLEGPQNPNGTCSAGVLFDPTNIHDLGFDIIDTDGITTLITVNANPAGGSETTVDFPLPAAGNYYIRVFGDATNNIQAYEMDLAVDEEPPPVECQDGKSCGEWNLPNGGVNGFAYGILHDLRLNCIYKLKATLVETIPGQGTVTGVLWDDTLPDPDFDIVGKYSERDDCINGTWKADIYLAGTNLKVGGISGKFCDQAATDQVGMYSATWEICLEP